MITHLLQLSLLILYYTKSSRPKPAQYHHHKQKCHLELSPLLDQRIRCFLRQSPRKQQITFPSIYLSILSSLFYLFTSICLYLFIYLCIYLALFISLFIFLLISIFFFFLYSSLYLSIHPFVCLPICLSTYLSFVTFRPSIYIVSIYLLTT